LTTCRTCSTTRGTDPYESTCHWWRRPRTRAGLEAGAVAQSCTVVYVAPGNGGTALDGRLVNINITDVKALREWAQAEKIVLTVVGPEAPLAAGVVDEFRAHGLRVFGPTKAAAQLESSKAFSKAFMKRHGIPTAEYDSFTDPRWPMPMWTRWARPSSSRPTAWRQAKAWWWP
jgi:hypothetical protein